MFDWNGKCGVGCLDGRFEESSDEGESIQSIPGTTRAAESVWGRGAALGGGGGGGGRSEMVGRCKEERRVRV